MQDNLRKQVKIIKATYEKEFTYKDISEMLDININSFYNWLNGAYDLGEQKERKLRDFINDLL